MDVGSDLESADMFMGITGASQAVAIRMLQDNGGDLNAAVNAFFNERDTTLPSLQRDEPVERVDYMDEDAPGGAPASVQESRGLGLPPWGVPRPMFNPLQSLFERPPAAAAGGPPIVSHPRDIRSVPIDWQDPAPPSLSIHEVTGSENVPRGQGGIVSMDDDLPTFPLPSGYPRRSPEHDPYTPVVTEVPSVPAVDYEVEEEMLQAALEESRRDAARMNDPAAAAAEMPVVNSEDDDIARAVSLSLKTAEDEKRLRDLAYDDTDVPLPDDATRRETAVSSSNIIPIVDVEEPEEQPLLRRRSRRNIQVPVDPPPASGHVASAPQPNGDMLPSDEWGGISSEEQHEAVMLEAVFGGGLAGIPYPMQRDFDFDPSVAAPDARRQPLSPSVVAQRLLREQQDDEYLASLAADREKELKAQQEAEAASELEKVRREEEQRKFQAEAELEQNLAAKAESLPPEPSQEDDSAVNILVRLPDGSRHGRRFRKSDTLQNLFDFIDSSRAVKVGTYRLVRQYPRQTFTSHEHTSTFDSLGLTSKQEALFLETI